MMGGSLKKGCPGKRVSGKESKEEERVERTRERLTRRVCMGEKVERVGKSRGCEGGWRQDE